MSPRATPWSTLSTDTVMSVGCGMAFGIRVRSLVVVLTRKRPLRA